MYRYIHVQVNTLGVWTRTVDYRRVYIRRDAMTRAASRWKSNKTLMVMLLLRGTKNPFNASLAPRMGSDLGFNRPLRGWLFRLLRDNRIHQFPRGIFVASKSVSKVASSPPSEKTSAYEGFFFIVVSFCFCCLTLISKTDENIYLQAPKVGVKIQLWATLDKWECERMRKTCMEFSVIWREMNSTRILMLILNWITVVYLNTKAIVR